MNGTRQSIRIAVEFPALKAKNRTFDLVIPYNSILTAYEKTEDIINEICYDLICIVDKSPMVCRAIKQLMLLKNKLNDALVSANYDQDECIKNYYATMASAMTDRYILGDFGGEDIGNGGFHISISVITDIISENDIDAENGDGYHA